MYHLRDSNYRKQLPRNCVFRRFDNPEEMSIEDNPFCPAFFESGMVLALEMDRDAYVTASTGSLSDSFEENFQRFQLFYAT
jgi:hypothetical protein